MSSGSFILASASPRRSELLKQLGLGFVVQPQPIDESMLAGEEAAGYVRRLARNKSLAGRVENRLPVLGADTIVVVDDHVLGKPANEEEGLAMLASLSGRWHRVMTAVAVSGPGAIRECLSVTDVCFREIKPAEARAYWNTGEPADKAGGYAIQGVGGMFVTELRGSYSGVVGLPLYETVNLLADFGIQPLSG